jgi:hypothetical protein
MATTVRDTSAACAASASARKARCEERLAFARAWRIRTKPYFDAIYGPEIDQ